MSDTILAIDLGRFKSVACVYSRSRRDHAFRTIDSKPDALAKLLAEHSGAVVVIEACANAGWVHDQAVAAGHAVKVANTEAMRAVRRLADQNSATSSYRASAALAPKAPDFAVVQQLEFVSLEH